MYTFKVSLLMLTAVALLAPGQALALNCYAADTELAVGMYNIYLQSGRTPKMKSKGVDYLETSVRINGTAIGLMNYEPCWREKPACHAPADYRELPLTVTLSQSEFAEKYGEDHADVAVLECFMKIGAGGKYQARNRP